MDDLSFIQRDHQEIPVKHSVSSVREPHTHMTPSEYLMSETLSTTPTLIPPPYELASQ
ncbi:hypothetical protein RYX36_003744 [Vicia faba]